MTASKQRSERWDEEPADREFTQALDKATPEQFKALVKGMADLPRPATDTRPAAARRDGRDS